MLDSIFAFTDYPIRLLLHLGSVGFVTALVLGIIVVVAKLMDNIDLPGYAATIITVLFFGGINLLGLGVVGTYAWRTYENTKSRPLAVIAARYENEQLS